MSGELNFLNVASTAALGCIACQIVNKQMTFLLSFSHKNTTNNNNKKTSRPLETEFISRGNINSSGAHVEKHEAFLLPLQRDTWHHSPENHCHSGGGDCDSLLYKDIQASNHGPFQMSN